MKKRKILLACASLLLTACQTSTPSSTLPDSTISEDLSSSSSSDTTSSSSSSRRETLYDKLTNAFSRLTENMTITGMISHGTYDGSNQEQTYYNTIIEVGDDSYYYLEEDQKTGEHLVEENYFSDEEGHFGSRTLNYATNEVEETLYTTSYSSVMDNPLEDLTVGGISGIREQPNWYLIDDYKLSSQILYFLTGYTTTGLPGYEPSYSYTSTDYTPTMTEFALHFDGDNIDQFRILIEYELSEDDGTYYYEGMLFELDISKLGSTTPREMEALEHTDNHDKLTKALAPYNTFNCDNFTMHVDVSYDTNQLQPESYNYLIDYEKEILYSDVVNNGTIYATSDEEEDTPYTYHGAYQYENGTLYLYRYDSTTNEFIKKDDFVTYWGVSGDTSNISFMTVAPIVNALAPECYKDNGNNSFTTYSVIRSTAARALLTFDEYVFSTINSSFTVNLNEDGSFKNITYSYTSTFALDETYTNTVSATKTYTITYTDLNTTTIPSFCVEHN